MSQIFSIHPTKRSAHFFLICSLLTSFLGFLNVYLLAVSVALLIGGLFTILNSNLILYILDDNNFVLESGFLSKDILTIPLSKIQTVDMEISATQRYFNLGNITITTSSEVDGENHIDMVDIDDPRHYHKLLMDAIARKD